MINRTFLEGLIGQDPEVRFSSTGGAICVLSIAHKEVYETKAGKQEKTHWFSVTTFGKTAENCAAHLRKGSKVVVEARLKDSRFQGKDGKTVYKTDIVAVNVEFFLGGKSSSSSSGKRAVEDLEDLTPSPKQQRAQQEADDGDIPF